MSADGAADLRRRAAPSARTRDGGKVAYATLRGWDAGEARAKMHLFLRNAISPIPPIARRAALAGSGTTVGAKSQPITFRLLSWTVVNCRRSCKTEGSLASSQSFSGVNPVVGLLSPLRRQHPD